MENQTEGELFVRRRLLSLLIVALVAVGLLGVVSTASGAPPPGRGSQNTLCNFGAPSWYGFSGKASCHAFFDAGGRMWSLQQDLYSKPNPAPDWFGNQGVWSFTSKGAADSFPGNLLPFQRSHDVGTPLGTVTQYEWGTDTTGNDIPLLGSQGQYLAIAHPGFPGSNSEQAVINWTAPYSGSYQLSVDMWAGDTACLAAHPDIDGIDWSCSGGGYTADGHLSTSGAHFTASTPLVLGRAGEAVHLAFSPGNNANCDTVALHLTILKPGS